MLSDLYEDVTPDSIYPEYVPDSIDKYSSSVDAALLLYGTVSDSDQIRRIEENPLLHSIFMGEGQKDFDGFEEISVKMYLALKKNVPTELHIFAETGHGFGVGPSEDVSSFGRPIEGIQANVTPWPKLADKFLTINFGLESSFIQNI